MHRSTVNFLLAASLVILFSLAGLYGYRLFRNVYLPMVRPVPVGSSVHFSAGPDLQIKERLRSTPSGVVADITLSNLSAEDFTRASITDVKYDSFSPKRLPIVVKSLPKGTSTVITVAVPGLKTTTPGYKSYDYKYDWPSGGGSGTFSTGMPPPVSPPKASKNRSAGIKV